MDSIVTIKKESPLSQVNSDFILIAWVGQVLAA